MRFYEFVREHVIPFNAVIALSVTVAAVLDFLAPQAPFLAWLSYLLAAAVLLAMALEVRAQRSNVAASGWHVQLLNRLRSPPGPLWKSPAWQVVSVIAVVSLVLGQASKASADSGGLIAGAAPNLRNVQVLLLGLQQDTRRIQTTLDAMAPKVDSIQSSVAEMETAIKGPREYLELGDYAFLQKHVASGKKLPQSGLHLLLGLNRKRDDRFQLLKLYLDNGFDIRRPVPLETLAMTTLIDDESTIKNVAKLNAWSRKRYELDAMTLLISCGTMDLLTYSYIANDKLLTDWLIQRGISPTAQYDCALGSMGVKKWTVTTGDIQSVLSQ